MAFVSIRILTSLNYKNYVIKIEINRIKFLFKKTLLIYKKGGANIFSIQIYIRQ